MDVENLRVPAEHDICAMTEISTDGREWICILKPHKKVYERREGSGEYRHFMVNRWPYREEKQHFLTDETISKE